MNGQQQIFRTETGVAAKGQEDDPRRLESMGVDAETMGELKSRLFAKELRDMDRIVVLAGGHERRTCLRETAERYATARLRCLIDTPVRCTGHEKRRDDFKIHWSQR